MSTLHTSSHLLLSASLPWIQVNNTPAPTAPGNLRNQPWSPHRVTVSSTPSIVWPLQPQQGSHPWMPSFLARQVPILLTYRSISTMTMLVFPTLLKLGTSILSLSKSSDQFQLLTREWSGVPLYWLPVPLKCHHLPRMGSAAAFPSGSIVSTQP